MADREDIDALLVGALYGELDEPDRARLDAHLASHPQDRMALDAMRSTRGLVRDAELAAAMVEPPAAVSALLLQEAARRAPQARTAGAGGGGILGFLASFLRPVMAHPALATAAMLVVVAGTAGALYVRGAGHPVRPDRSLPAAAAPASASREASEWVAAQDDPALATERDKLAKYEQQAAPMAAGSTAGSAAGSSDGRVEGYRVSLDDGKSQPREGKDGERVLGFADNAPKPAAKGAKESGATGGEHGGWIEVARPEQPGVRAPEDDGDVDLALGSGTGADRAKPTAIAQGAQGAAPPPPPAAPAATGSLATQPDPNGAFALAPRANTGPGTPVAGATTGAAMDSRLAAPYNARSDAATIAWARDQHARMVKLADAGKCSDAGTLGAQIQRRAPDYYQQYVFNDRRIRACRAYVDRSRRMAEPAPKRDLPSPAAADEAAAPEKTMH